MANIKSSKKDIKRIIIRTKRNRARMSEIKTFSKKLELVIGQGNLEEATLLFKVVQAKVARARGKGLLKANNASRRISHFAKALSASAGNTSAAK